MKELKNLQANTEKDIVTTILVDHCEIVENVESLNNTVEIEDNPVSVMV